MKIKLFVKYISLLVLLFVADGCKEKKADTYVTKVTDLTGEEEQVLKLEYDRDGKIIKYGDTPVRYEGDQITIGQMDCLNTGNKLCNVTFQIGKGKARESRARCMLKLINRLSMIIKEILFLSILIIVLLPIIVS